MKKVWIIIISLLSLGFLVVASFFLVNYLNPKLGGISVTSTPESSVFINGKLVGKTPYKFTFKPGEYTLKLASDVEGKNYPPFETKVSLISGVETVIRREFGEEEELSSGEVITFEKEEGKNSSLVVISTPDSAQVSIDGIPKGFTPYKVSTLSSGEHQIAVKAVGYTEKTITVNLVSGYRLSMVTYLKQESKPETQVAGEKTQVKTFVEILETPTGFLRVRTEPGSAGSEIHQVKPGEKYPYLEEDSTTGWFKIQIQEPAAGLPDGIVGWVSNEFSKKIDEEVTIPNTSN